MRHQIAWLLSLLAGGAASAEAQNRVLLLPGQNLPGAGTVTQVGDFAMNAQGSWIALAETDQISSGFAVLVRDGQPLYIPDGVAVAPLFTGDARFLDQDDFGNVAYVGRDPAGSGWVLMVNGTPLLRQWDAVDLNGDGQPDPVQLHGAGILTGDGSKAVYVMLGADIGMPIPRHYLTRLERDASGTLQVQVLLAPGDAPAFGAQVTNTGLSRLWYRTQMDTTKTGRLVFSLDQHGIFRYEPSVPFLFAQAFNGQVSPFFSIPWSMAPYPAVTLDNNVAALFGTTLAGLGFSFGAVIREQSLALVASGTMEYPKLTTVGEFRPRDALRVGADGQVVWAATFDSEIYGTARGLAVGRKVAVLEGVTHVEGHQIASISMNFNSNHDVTSDGQRIRFRGRTAANAVGLFEVNIASQVEAIAGCQPKSAQLALNGALDTVGVDSDGFTLRLSGSPAPGVPGFLFLAASGGTGCGTLIPGLGEILIDLQPGLFLTQVPESYGQFNTAFFPVTAFAQNLMLQGLPVYAQGAWLNLQSASEPVRLSNALRLVAGI